MKIQSHALLIAIAAVLGTAAHAQSNGSGNASWGAYRSIVNPSYVDSHDRTTNVDTTVDSSRRADGSFNQDNDVDASRRTVGSFNQDNDVDASRRTFTSVDVQAVTPTVSSRKDIATADTQTAGNVAYLSGHEQNGQQGALVLDMSGGGSPAYAHGGFYKSPAGATVQYDVNASNSMLVDGDNNGLMRNQNNLNFGGAQISDSDIGHKLIQSAGAQTLGQGVNQEKESATQTYASDAVSTTVSK